MNKEPFVSFYALNEKGDIRFKKNEELFYTHYKFYGKYDGIEICVADELQKSGLSFNRLNELTIPLEEQRMSALSSIKTEVSKAVDLPVTVMSTRSLTERIKGYIEEFPIMRGLMFSGRLRYQLDFLRPREVYAVLRTSKQDFLVLETRESNVKFYNHSAWGKTGIATSIERGFNFIDHPDLARFLGITDFEFADLGSLSLGLERHFGVSFPNLKNGDIVYSEERGKRVYAVTRIESHH